MENTHVFWALIRIKNRHRCLTAKFLNKCIVSPSPLPLQFLRLYSVLRKQLNDLERVLVRVGFSLVSDVGNYGGYQIPKVDSIVFSSSPLWSVTSISAEASRVPFLSTARQFFSSQVLLALKSSVFHWIHLISWFLVWCISLLSPFDFFCLSSILSLIPRLLHLVQGLAHTSSPSAEVCGVGPGALQPSDLQPWLLESILPPFRPAPSSVLLPIILPIHLSWRQSFNF